MSLSKGPGQLTKASASEQPRQPKCTRCRHHGIIVPQKGHVKFCPFLKCNCWKCYLITQRTRITALQRNLMKAQSKPHDKEQRPGGPIGVSVRKPAAERTPSALAPDGGACPSATSGLMCSRSGRSAATTTTATAAPWSPLNPRSRPAPGGEPVAGLESKETLPLTSSGEGPCSPFSVPYLDEIGQTPPLPAIRFPFRMPNHFPSSYVPFPNFLFNMPWLPPVSPGFYNDGLHGPQIFPHFQQSAVHYPPPPEPGPPAECRPIFFTLQPPPPSDAFQEEQISRQHLQPPLPKLSEPVMEELD